MKREKDCSTGIVLRGGLLSLVFLILGIVALLIAGGFAFIFFALTIASLAGTLLLRHVVTGGEAVPPGLLIFGVLLGLGLAVVAFVGTLERLFR